MEPRSRETTPTKEDLDSDYVPNDKYLVSGKEFEKLTRNAKKLGAESLDYSTRKNNKYMVTLKSGKKFILDRQNMLIIVLTKTKKEEINILLELQRLRINKES